MYRTLKKTWGPEICSWVPLAFWHWLLGVEIVLPRYHVVSDQVLAHFSGLIFARSVQKFKADVEFFLQSYAPVSLQDIISHLDGTCQLPKRCFLLTFDDGFREIYDVIAPILKAQGAPAVFFVTTSVIDNRELCYQQKQSLLIHALATLENSYAKQKVSQILTKAEIEGPDLLSRIRNITYHQRKVLEKLGPVLECDFDSYVASVQPYLTSAQISNLMLQGFDIGAHSVDHPLYSDLSLEEQLHQTRDSLNWLSERFQYECQSFAFPYRDAGVSSEFFKTIFAEGRLKVSFGIHGMQRHFFPRNFERFTMEQAHLNTEQALAREYFVTLLRRPPWRQASPPTGKR
jgi:peptidoglycan/xylan/chitin deacetylase (PgdA/CDA1 family)